MRRSLHAQAVAGLVVLFALPALTAAQAPAPAAAAAPAKIQIAPPTPPKPLFVDDERIGAAIEKGQEWLMGQFTNSKLTDYDDEEHHFQQGAGCDALCVYSLMQCGLATHKSELQVKAAYMGALLDTLKGLKVQLWAGTYTRGLRCTVYALGNRLDDRGAMLVDVSALLDTCHQGAFNYLLMPDDEGSHNKKGYLRPGGGDNSNSQYGLLGIWSAAEAGAEIPDDVWEAIEKHWTKTQFPDGGWSYDATHGESNAMTLAGIASLFVCHDYLDVAKFGTAVGREPFSPALIKGLAWIEQGERAGKDVWNGYTAYGVERVGLASGFKYLGTHDWYRELATKLVESQQPDGTWGGTGEMMPSRIETAYKLLFLARGRHPLMMSKLRFEHFWANRPRDLANLCTYSGRELEAVFNWQVVGLDHEASDWSDAPILYIASHEAPKLNDADFARIRAFADGGGMIFTQADGGSAGFDNFVEKTLVPKVFNGYELQKLPANHVLYSMMGPMKQPPQLKMVSNGARLLLVHSSNDISQYWQQRASKSHADAFHMGLCLFLYAAGKSDFSNRLASPFIAAPPTPAAGNVIRVARVKYALPTWDPEPGAWQRFSRWMGWQTGVGISAEPVDMDALATLPPANMPLAHLCGTFSYKPTDSQIAAIHKYVADGGVLFIDTCGATDFNDSVTAMLAKAFPGQRLEKLSLGHPLFNASDAGMSELGKPPLRPYAKNLGTGGSFMTLKEGRGRVIYSPRDITNALLGTRMWGIDGYESSYALNFVKNLTLWAARGAPDELAASAPASNPAK